MRYLFLHILLILIPAASFAATDTLSVADGSGLPGDRVEVQVALTNAGRIAGVQFDMVADQRQLRWGPVRCVARAMGMDVHSQIVGDTLRVVLLDPGRRAAVAAGSGPVLSVQADLLAASGEVRIGLGRAKVADDGRPPQAREAAAKAGRLLVLSNLLSLRDGEGKALVLLSNADRVAAAQFDLVYDPAEVSVAEVRLSSRCAGMAVFEATASAGRTRVVAADLRGEAWISPGEGAVAEVLFRSRWASSGMRAAPVQIEGAVLSGPGGVLLPVGARGGTVSVTPRQRPRVVIEEALSDPPDGPSGDANGDGVRDAYQDEFVEVLNADTAAVDVSRWTLSDDDAPAARFRFPQGTVLRPGERAVLFGGGRPAGVPGHVFVDDGRIGDGLSNAGDLVLLIDTEGDTISTAALGGAEGQSLVRLAEGGFGPHGAWPGRGAFSPGRARPVASGLRVAPEAVTLRRGESASLRVVAAFTDGVEDTVRAGLAWSSDRPEVAAVEGSGKVTGRQAGAARVTARIGELSAGAGVRVEDPPRIPPVVTPPSPVVTPPSPVVTPPSPVVTPPSPVVTPPSPVVTPPPVATPPAAPAPNRPPTLETVSLRPARAGVFYREQVVASDADGDRLTFSIVYGPGWLGVDAGTGVLSGRPAPGWAGEAAVEMQVEDGRGGAARRSYALTVLPRRRVVIDEVLTDPPAGLSGDANGDGVRDTYQDEFIEVLNADTAAVDVSGWTLSDDDAPAAGRFRFPQGTVLRRGERAVLFGGGRPTGFAGRVFVDDGRIGDGLSNAGEKVLLFDPQEGDTVDVVALPKAEGQSLVRLTEGTFALHGAWPGRGAFSPGRARPVASGLRVAPEGVRLWPGGSALLRAVAMFTDGVEDTVRAGLAWSSDRPEVAAVEGGGRVSGLRTGVATIRVSVGGLSAQTEVAVEPPPNRSPTLETASLRPARAGVFYREQVVASDADGDRLKFSLTEGPGWLGIDAGTGLLSGRPDRAGEAAVEMQVEDGRGGVTRRSYTLTVLPRRRVVIDEVLTDPPEGLAGDANRDGVRDTYQDEFIEVLNADTADVVVSGWTLSDDDASVANRFRFPQGTVLHPGERAVLFGGGRPTGFAGRVFVDDGRIGDGLSNAGEKVLLFDPQEGDTVDVVALPKAEGQSLARYPEGAGAFVLHSAWPGRGAFSPGRGRPLLQGIAATGDSGPMRPGERRGMKAVAVYSDSGAEEVTDRVTWVEGDTSVARLEGRGLVRAVRPGQADFVARWGYVASQPYRVKVIPFENRPPAMALLPDTAVTEDSPLRLRAQASDPDGDEVRFSLAHAPAWLSIDPGSGLISGVPDDPDVGAWEVTVEASDGRLTASRTFRVAVRNRPPAFGEVPRRRGRVGVEYRDTLRVNNLDGGSVRLTNGPPGLEMEGALLRWRPSASGRWPVTALARDPHGGEATLSWEMEALPLPFVVVEEVLADPPRGAAGDANGDGRGDGGEDEFIELLNAGQDAAALGGLTLGPEGTSGARLFQFPEGTAVPPGGRLLLFGGGAPGDFPCPVFVAGGRIGRGLSADGGVVLLTDPAGPDTLLRAAFPGRGRGQSWARRSGPLRVAQGDGPVTQGQEAFVLHGDLPGRGRFSPGRPRPLLIGLSVAAETTMVAGKRRPFKVIGIFNDGVQEIVTERVTVIVSDTSVARIEGDDRLVGVGEGRCRVQARFEEIEGVAEVRVVPGRGLLAGGRSPAGGPQPDRVLSQIGTPPVQDTVAVGADYRLRVASPPEASVQWSVVEGPAWLAVEPETGDLVGRPPGEGTFQVVLSGQDNTGQEALVVVTLTARPEAERPERGPPEEGLPGDDGDELSKKIRRRRGEADSDEAAVPGAGPGRADPPAQGRPAEGREVALVSNYPNPFNGTTVLRCRSPTPGRAAVYTLLGQCVRRWAEVGAAETSLVWDGRDASGRALPSGVYFLVFEAEGVRAVRRMTLIR